ncbi:MAG: 50S ribosomal protein L11 methyltransferase [Deltaproteobacteria bacterium HGW-Deltaproteobacteria-12]|jgi:ribosomal protein L11 methyltransferase|nr:MAG: 50S ribosomal protein L11 methyltransferase [Deltaproteobacteria bacterium HGW-Deltaproteobacteria-12]
MAEKEPEKWLKIEITARAELMDALGNFLTETGASGVFQETSGPQSQDDFPESPTAETIKAYFPWDARSEKRIAAVQKYLESLGEIFADFPAPALRTEAISDPDWGEQWKKYFKPIRVCNNIIVKPTWERYAPSSRDIVIEIDPGMAFGTGQHESTRMCIEALEAVIMKDRSVQDWKVLDVGCGTGILGITAARLGAQDVICIDIDKKATEIAGENASINLVSDRLHVFSKDATSVSEPRNLIIANLTAKLLLKLRHHLTKLLLPEGYLIISGIVEQDAKEIEDNFSVAPLILSRVIKEKEWVCYVLKKKSSSV